MHPHHSVCVGKAEADADGVDKEGVQTHTAGLGQRQIGQNTCQNRANNGGNGGGDVDGAVGNPQRIGAVTKGVGKHIGVDHQNVDHGKECGHAGDQLSFHIGAAFVELKESFHF